MPFDMEFFNGISFDIAKQKYYNANKVDAAMNEIRAAAAELIAENAALKAQLTEIGMSKEKVGELMLGAQEKADEIVSRANSQAEEILNAARLEAQSMLLESGAQTGSSKTGLSGTQLAAIDKLNKQLDDFNVSQATQIFRIKQALMSIALDE